MKKDLQTIFRCLNMEKCPKLNLQNPDNTERYEKGGRF